MTNTIIERLFDDKIAVCRMLLLWLALICTVFVWLGTQSVPFFHVGPSPHTVVMGVVIDSWGTWACVTVLTFCNTLCTEYVYDCLHPWLMTTVIDHKTTNVGYNKSDLVYISVVSSVYRVVIQVVMIYVMLSQIDFLIVRVTADVLVTVVATRYFLRDKECASVPLRAMRYARCGEESPSEIVYGDESADMRFANTAPQAMPRNSRFLDALVYSPDIVHKRGLNKKDRDLYWSDGHDTDSLDSSRTVEVPFSDPYLSSRSDKSFHADYSNMSEKSSASNSSRTPIARDPPVYTRVQTRTSTDDRKVLRSGDIFQTAVPFAVLLGEILLFVIVLTAVIYAEKSGPRPWIMRLYSLDRHTVVARALDNFFEPPKSAATGSPKIFSTDNDRDNYLRASSIVNDVYPDFVADQMGMRCDPGTVDMQHPQRSCGTQNYMSLLEKVHTAFNDFTKTTLKTQKEHATSAQLRELRENIAEMCYDMPTHHRMRFVTHVDILVVLFLWCSGGIFSRAVTNWAHTRTENVNDNENIMYTRGGLSWVPSSVLFFAFLIMMGSFAYAIYRFAESENVGLEFMTFITAWTSLLIGMWTMWMTYAKRGLKSVHAVYYVSASTAEGNDANDDTYGFNASWVMLAVVKPVLVVPAFVLCVFTVSGVFHFDSLLYAILLTLGLTILCTGLSYYNLYATNRKWLASPSTQGMAHDKRVEDKGRRPMHVVSVGMLCTFFITFLPWPRRYDVDTFWPVEFCIFFMFFGFLTMVLPDVVYHRRYMSALLTREAAELCLRVIVTITVCSMVFRTSA